MRAIYDQSIMQVEITNACHLSCRHCTRHVGHHRKPFFMSLEFFEKAVKSLDQFPGRVGIMGGEPAMHPKFRELLALYRDLVPEKGRREFWTAGFKWGEFKPDIEETFFKHRISYNDHIAYDGKHQPLLVAINEVVDDEELKAELIDNCWVGNGWSGSITPKGGFFCEVAASLDWLLDGPGGYDISDPRWWDKDDTQFADQVERYCGDCSGAIPFEAYSDGRGGRDGPAHDLVSPGMLAKLTAAGSPKVARGHVDIFDQKITRETLKSIRNWKPTHYRTFVAHTPEDVDEALGSCQRIGMPTPEVLAGRHEALRKGQTA